jgi:hypothetical protein
MRSFARLALGLLLATSFSGGVAAAADVDSDGDGVVDAVDQCPDTPAFDIVDATGCSVCDCDGDANGNDWGSRSAYLHCVLDSVHQGRLDSTLTRTRARAVLHAARSSTCGSAHLVRCCLMFPGRPSGICRIMDELRCDQGMSSNIAEDFDTGSCLPNPCVP